jgi:hypothetical protein
MLRALRPFALHKGKTIFCADCGNVSTQEALIAVDEDITLIERYYDICSRNAN